MALLLAVLLLTLSPAAFAQDTTPPVEPPTPIPSDTPVPPSDTPIPPSQTPVPPTNTETPLPPTDTDTPLPPMDTATESPSPTFTDTAAAVPTPSQTATASVTATISETPTSTGTGTQTTTATATGSRRTGFPTPLLNVLVVGTATPPAPDVNLISNGTFANGLIDWAFSGSTQQIENGALKIAPTTGGGGFYQFVNYNSAGEIFEVNFRASNPSPTVKTLNLIVRDTAWATQYNCVFTLSAYAPQQFYRMRFDTAAGFIPMVFQGALSGDSSLGLLIDDITMVRKTGITVPTTECTVAPPGNTNLVYDGEFNQGAANWAAFNATMNFTNIGGANGNIMQIGRNANTPDGGFYQYNPYSAPANGVLQFSFQMGNQSNQSRVINMLIRNPDWTDNHSCFITVPANTPLTNYTIIAKTTTAWSNIVIQGWIQVGDYVSGAPPFRFDKMSVQYLPTSGFSGSTQCPSGTRVCLQNRIT
jgi:hypothetical protein